jgi:5-(carboxyamino)imidazole ribonucleotide mutase
LSESHAGRPQVLLLCGSPNDLDPVLDAQEVLESLGVSSRIDVVSAHRTPDLAQDSVRKAEAEGVQVIIAFAGLTAHLAGVAAAHSRLPVIGVPLAVGPLGGIDAALATLQMPPGTPVAAVAIGGARNAALLAARILSIAHPALRERLSAAAEGERERYHPEATRALVERRKRERRGD